MNKEIEALEKEKESVQASEQEKIELLASELASARYEALKSQHRLMELERGRVFRTIAHIKKSLINPSWGFKNLSAIPSLLMKNSISPLVERPQSARELLEEIGQVTLPTKIHNHPRTMLYPHIKVACIGDPDWLSFVAHTFEIDKVEWNELLQFGIDMAVVMGATENSRVIQSIKTLRKADVPMIWNTDNVSKEFIKNNSKPEDIYITSYPKSEYENAIYVAPSVDITEFNPANWDNRTKLGPVYTIAPANKHGRNRLPLLDIYSPDFFGEAKKYKYIECSPSDFSQDIVYVETILKLYASGVPVLTKGSPALKNLIHKDLHSFYRNEEDKESLKAKLENIHERERISIKLRNYVIANHSHINRFEQLLNVLGIDLIPQQKISVIASTNRGDHVEELIKTVASQSYPEKELLLILHGVSIDSKKLREAARKQKLPLTIINQPKDSLFGENLNIGLDKATGIFITKMDDDDFYGPNHLWDLYWAWMYSGAFAVGKWGNFVYLKNRNITLDFATKREEKFGRHLPGATIFILKSDLMKLGFGRVKRAIDSEMLRRAEMRGARLYSTHRYNFVRVRHGSHTYKQDDEDFIANSDGKPRKNIDLDDCFI